MERTLTNFIRSLRTAEVRVSTAETLDAINTVELVGYENREFLKHSLSLVLPKTADEKETFDACFEQFFLVQGRHVVLVLIGGQPGCSNPDADRA